jgi:hypothetical protein
MNTRICSAVVVTMSVAVIAAAQTLPVSPRVTIIGCIQRSEPPSPRAGATVANADETRYVLTNVTLAESPSVATDGPSAVISENVNRYRLQDSTDGIIGSHVGERVEVSGAVLPADAATGTAGREGSSRREALPPLLKVESLKTIAGSSACSS